MADFCTARKFPGMVKVGAGIGCTLVIVNHISKMISAAIVGFSHAHGVVGKVDIAVVALIAWLVEKRTRWRGQNLQKSA